MLLHAYPLLGIGKTGRSRRIGMICKPFSLLTLTLCGLILICQDVTDTFREARLLPEAERHLLFSLMFSLIQYSASNRYFLQQQQVHLFLFFALRLQPGAGGHLKMIHCERALVRVCSDRCHNCLTIVVLRIPVY